MKFQSSWQHVDMATGLGTRTRGLQRPGEVPSHCPSLHQPSGAPASLGAEARSAPQPCTPRPARPTLLQPQGELRRPPASGPGRGLPPHRPHGWRSPPSGRSRCPARRCRAVRPPHRPQRPTAGTRPAPARPLPGPCWTSDTHDHGGPSLIPCPTHAHPSDVTGTGQRRRGPRGREAPGSGRESGQSRKGFAAAATSTASLPQRGARGPCRHEMPASSSGRRLGAEPRGRPRAPSPARRGAPSLSRPNGHPWRALRPRPPARLRNEDTRHRPVTQCSRAFNSV